MKVRLKVLNGSAAGKVIKVSGPKFLIGRDESCHIRPSSDLISRRHCVLLVSESGVEVRDLKSRNGVYVNDERIVGDRALTTRDRLKIGKLVLEVFVEVPQAVKALDKGSRLADPKTSDSTSDEDINLWLHEEDKNDQTQILPETETKHFKMEETDRVLLETPTDTVADESVPEETPKEETKKKKKPKKLPQKKPSFGVDSGDAATESLKKFFNRR